MELWLFLRSPPSLSAPLLPVDVVASSLTKAANGSAAEEQKDGYDPSIYIPSFSDSGPLSNWNQHVSHIWCVSLLWFSRLTFTPGVKMHLWYTHLNWISLPSSKPQQIAVHICCHFPFLHQQQRKNDWVQLWETVQTPSVLQINFSHRWNCSSTGLNNYFQATSGTTSMYYCKCCHCLIQMLNTLSYHN